MFKVVVWSADGTIFRCMKRYDVVSFKLAGAATIKGTLKPSLVWFDEGKNIDYFVMFCYFGYILNF